jgi:hypothetical protein
MGKMWRQMDRQSVLLAAAFAVVFIGFSDCSDETIDGDLPQRNIVSCSEACFVVDQCGGFSLAQSPFGINADSCQTTCQNTGDSPSLFSCLASAACTQSGMADCVTLLNPCQPAGEYRLLLAELSSGTCSSAAVDETVSVKFLAEPNWQIIGPNQMTVSGELDQTTCEIAAVGTFASTQGDSRMRTNWTFARNTFVGINTTFDPCPGLTMVQGKRPTQ